MIIWVLLALDIIAFTATSFAHFGVAVSTGFLVACAAYLMAKFAVFREIMSGIDAVFGVYIIIMAVFHIQIFIYYLMAAWFAYKLIFTITSAGR